MFKKVLSAALVVTLTAGILGYQYLEEKFEINSPGKKEVVLHVWYTDDKLTDYYNSAALAYFEKTGVRIEMELHSGLEYLEEINKASLYSEEIPDVFSISNDSLEKAYLTGLASEISDPYHVVNDGYFPQTAIHAVTYKDKRTAYPFTYETSALIYNKTYLDEIARKSLEAERDKKEGEEAQEKVDAGEVETEVNGSDKDLPEITEDAIMEREAEIFPKSMDDILKMADSYDPATGMEEYMKWDVSDIFYNYFFLGAYINVGGETGDQPEEVNIYNENARSCLDIYQRLNQFFSIEADTTDYNSVIQEFIDGKTLFTIATSDVIGKLEAARNAGEFPYEYGVSMIPKLSDGTYFVEEYTEDEQGNVIEYEDDFLPFQNKKDIPELESRGLSVTTCHAVNGFTKHREDANRFASFLSTGYLDTLYDRTGKLACTNLVKYDNPAFNGFIQEYEKSISMPKLTRVANFWVELEILFTKVWIGEDSDKALKKVNEQIRMELEE